MIKRLEKRFILTAMLAITILLTGLLGTINIANAVISSEQTDELLEIVTMPTARSMTEKERKENYKLLKKRRAAVFFKVRVNDKGEIKRINTNRIPDLSEEEAVQISDKVIKSNKISGKISGFKYKRTYNPNKSEYAYYFLDTSTHVNSVWKVLFLSICIGMLCLLVMIFPVILISKKAIRPIAENIEKQKQFVTDAGHELKTPLAIIMANTEAMELSVGENKYSKNIRTQITRLNSLMQNLLTLSKSDEMYGDYKNEEFCISDLALKTVSMFSEAMELKKLKYSFDIIPDIRITSNKEMLSNVISILTDNAVQYAKEEGFVSVKLIKKDKTTELSISNNCESLPKCEAEKLFDRFYREDKARTQKNGGSGIGLSAAQSIVNSLGGEIKAEYLPENVIKFTVVIQ